MLIESQTLARSRDANNNYCQVRDNFQYSQRTGSIIPG